MWIWGVTFVAVYFPLAVVIGHFHRKLQIPTEQKLLMYANPYIYIAQPGREQLFHMPILTLGFKAQLQAMILQNAMADAIEKIAKETGSLIPPIPRYDKLIFQEYENAIHVSESLTKGENILDILNSLKLLKSQEQNNQSWYAYHNWIEKLLLAYFGSLSQTMKEDQDHIVDAKERNSQ